MRGGRPDADRAGIDGRLALVTGRGRGQGKARSGLACRPRVPLAGSPGARRHRDTGQLLHGHSRWPHQEPGQRAVRSSRPRREIHGRAGRHEPGVKLEMEAFDGYYRPVNVKQLVMTSVPEGATRVAMLERGEADIIYSVPGELVSRVQKLPGVTLAPVLSGSWFLEFPGFQDPKSPFRDKRVREAVSLAIDRRAMNQAESAGFGKVSGNWINNDVQYALEWPEIERNVERAKQLLREAGYPNGFDVDWVTPLPAWYSRGERLIGQLREVGIRARMQTMERGVFFQRLQGGIKEWPGVQIIFHGIRIAGSWSFWYEAHVKCGGFNSRDRLCIKELDAKFEQYERSINPAERKRLAEEIQRAILENHYLVPVFRHAFVNAIGPRVAAQKWQDVFPTITTGYAYPWEDIKLKEQ